MSLWWPWAKDEPEEPAPPAYVEPELLGPDLELTEEGELEVLRGRIQRAQLVIGEAMRTHGNGWVPPDTLLDVGLALNPVPLRTATPRAGGTS